MSTPSRTPAETTSVDRVGFPDVAGMPTGRRFWTGVRFAASGIPTTVRSARLLGLSAVPVAIHTALYAALLWLGLTYVSDLLDWIGPEPGHWYSFLRWLVGALIIAAVAAVGLLVTVFFGSVVCDPFYDVLSESTEERLLGRSFGEPFTLKGVLPGVLRELVATLVRLSIFVPVALLIWSLNFIPVVGQILSAPLGLGWTWLFVCYELVSRSLSRHGLGPRERLGVLFSHKALALGFGAGAWLGLFLPFFAPFLVVGATRMYLALAAWDRAKSRLDEAAKASLRPLPHGR